MEISKLREKFKNKELLDQALTHRSWVNEHKGIRETNERLEFLGDAILEYVVSEKIYKMFPDKEEGFLTSLRSNLVNTTNLSIIAKNISVGKALFLSKGEEETGGRNNQSLLADTCEAIIGALYLDSGLDAVRQFLEANLFIMIKDKIKKPLKDAKSRLQEVVQAKSYPAPKYMVIETTGPDHAKEFTVEVIINQTPHGKGAGKSKSEAEQKAAEVALKEFL